MPSVGSVPEPSSSITTRLSLLTFFNISNTFTICAENVERFSDIFCPSPISHRKLLFIQISAFLHATCKPHCAIIQFNATVLIVTVLPPVLGPVITTPSKLFPISNCSGTHSDGAIRGCRPSSIRIYRCVLIFGSTPSYSKLSFPFEKIKSSFSIILIFCSKISS